MACFFQKEHTGRLVIGDHKSTSHVRSGEPPHGGVVAPAFPL